MRLIGADMLVKAFEKDAPYYQDQGGMPLFSLDDCTARIREQPTVDAVPVVHGKWIFGQSNHHEWMKCSECLHSYDVTGTFSYCPNCGADMIERKENERD